MSFHSKFKIPFRAPKTEIPAEGYTFERDKQKGTVAVTIFNKMISTQKADSLAKGAFPVPTKIQSKETDGDKQIRTYAAVGWA